MRAVWDASKDAANRRKHGLSFEEASALFAAGIDYLEIFDEAHSAEEDRFIAIGPIGSGVIVVVFVEPEEDTLRIISARRATRKELRAYQAHMQGRLP